MVKKSTEEFIGLLASKAAVPGGGGASALAGALGAALGNMVGELTIGKKKYADVEDSIRLLMSRAQMLSTGLLSCVDEDAAAFEPLSKAYGIPKDYPDRDEIMEKCLRDAAAVPLKIVDLCCETIDLLRGFAEMGSVLAVSDAATGAALCRGALYGASVNVRVNTRSMKDRQYAETVDSHVDEQMSKYGPMADQIFEDVFGRLSVWQ